MEYRPLTPIEVKIPSDLYLQTFPVEGGEDRALEGDFQRPEASSAFLFPTLAHGFAYEWGQVAGRVLMRFCDGLKTLRCSMSFVCPAKALCIDLGRFRRLLI